MRVLVHVHAIVHDVVSLVVLGVVRQGAIRLKLSSEALVGVAELGVGIAYRSSDNTVGIRGGLSVGVLSVGVLKILQVKWSVSQMMGVHVSLMVFGHGSVLALRWKIVSQQIGVGVRWLHFSNMSSINIIIGYDVESINKNQAILNICNFL